MKINRIGRSDSRFARHYSRPTKPSGRKRVLREVRKSLGTKEPSEKLHAQRLEAWNIAKKRERFKLAVASYAPQAMSAIIQLALDSRSPPMLKVRACKFIIDCAFGRERHSPKRNSEKSKRLDLRILSQAERDELKRILQKLRGRPEPEKENA